MGKNIIISKFVSKLWCSNKFCRNMGWGGGGGAGLVAARSLHEKGV